MMGPRETGSSVAVSRKIVSVWPPATIRFDILTLQDAIDLFGVRVFDVPRRDSGGNRPRRSADGPVAAALRLLELAPTRRRCDICRVSARPTERPWTSPLAGAGLVFAFVGSIDGIVAAVAARPPVTFATRLATGVLSAGLWTLFGLLVTLLGLVAVRLAFGPFRWREWGIELRARFRRIWRAEAAEDASRVARLGAGLFAIAGWAGASIALLAHLIATRNGAFLIAGTFVVAQFGIAAASVWFRAVLSRLFGKVASSPVVLTGALRPLFRLRNVVVFGVFVTVGVASVVVMSQGQLLAAVHAGTWALLGVGVAAALGVGPLIGLGFRRSRGITLLLIVASVAAMLGAAQSSSARRIVVARSISAHVLLSQLQQATDFDGDYIAWLPAFEDCGPLDPAIGPLAAEIAGDGIDSNCDGADDPPAPIKANWGAVGDVVIPAGKPDLILITVDSWRYDAADLTGDDGVMPNLKAFATEATVFTSAWSQDSGTGPSIWSMMAGKTPFQTKIDSSGRFPPSFLPEETTLAEHFKRGGYTTAAVLCGAMFAKKHWNIPRGFDSYDEVCGKRKALQAEPTAKAAIEKLRKLRSGDEPSFLWVHLYDPHRPYHDHPDQKRGGDARARYLEEVHYTDVWLGRLLDAVRDASRRTYVAITADHGEGFGEHGKDPHARTLYREVTHVPLVMWGADARPGVFHSPVAINDIHPTFLQLAGLPTDHSTMVSQAPVLFGARPSPARLVFQENSFARPRRHVKGVVGRGHHLLYDTTNDAWELYDLEKDPAEKKNLIGADVAAADELKTAIRAFIPTTKIPSKLAR